MRVDVPTELDTYQPGRIAEVMRSQHRARPFEDIIANETEVWLFVGNDIVGSCDWETLSKFGERA